MTTIDTPIGEAHVRSTKHSVQDYYGREDVPDFLRVSTVASVETGTIPMDRYTSQNWYDREMRDLWPKVWQMACHEQEVPEVGDRVVYEVGHHSIIIVRAGKDDIKAFHNSCLHRGNKLCVGAENEQHIQCPFHGWTWDLQGDMKRLPARWDFAALDSSDLRLPKVRVSRWLGFVFINMDIDATPLEDQIPPEITEQFARWGFPDRQVTVRVTKEFPVNWKAALDAFLESYHVSQVHPQLAPTTGDLTSQYDVISEYVNRMITLTAVPGPTVNFDMSEQDLANDMANYGFVDADGKPMTVAPDQRARTVLAGAVRQMMMDASGVDMSHWSDAEIIDGVTYQFFPNLIPMGNMTVPFTYRFLPHNDADHCLMEVYALFPTLPGSPKQRTVHRVLAEDEGWADVPELGAIGAILDQDSSNLLRLQAGMKASRTGQFQLAAYQESRIRHYHAALAKQLGEG